MILNMNINTALCIGAAALAFVASSLAALTALANRRWRARCKSLESSVAALRLELEALAAAAVTMDGRLQRIEQEFTGVADRVDVVELRGAARSFDQAIDWARRGGDPGKLTQQFGLSRGEADLVTRLHGRNKSA
jgi:hypothetical protein